MVMKIEYGYLRLLKLGNLAQIKLKLAPFGFFSGLRSFNLLLVLSSFKTASTSQFKFGDLVKLKHYV